jgi:hypothetical protein
MTDRLMLPDGRRVLIICIPHHKSKAGSGAHTPAGLFLGVADLALAVLVAAGFRLDGFVVDRVFLEVIHTAPEIIDEEVGEIAAETVPHQNTHDYQIFALGGML